MCCSVLRWTRNSILVIEHNLDVIRCSDWVIWDRGGDKGGISCCRDARKENPKILLQGSIWKQKALQQHPPKSNYYYLWRLPESGDFKLRHMYKSHARFVLPQATSNDLGVTSQVALLPESCSFTLTRVQFRHRLIKEILLPRFG